MEGVRYHHGEHVDFERRHVRAIISLTETKGV